jgi:deazaflavin-dependent oxidoreductase (nitroreductase family)
MPSENKWHARNLEIMTTFRANGGMEDHVLLTTIGAKSGIERTIPLIYTSDGDRVIIIASKGGSPTHPDWYHNLVANPIVTLELGGERFPARAILAEGQERTRLFDQMAEKFTFFAKYQQSTARQIPVIILERMN